MPNLNDIMEMMDALETKAIITIPTFCVAVRNRHSSCRKCADVCLADAFTIEKNELNIDAGACVACGACVAVCPTAALELPATYTVGNPETGETGDIIIGTAEIDPRTCLAYRMTGCRDCYDACNYGAIELKDEGGANPIPYVVEDKCNGCGACQAACLSLSSGSIKSSERAIVVRPVEA